MVFMRCYGCMGEISVPGAVCPRCGYDNSRGPAAQPSHVLPCGTVLNGQYVVGRMLGQGGFGITYIGFDLNLELTICIKEYYPEGIALRSGAQSGTVLWGTGDTAGVFRQNRMSFIKEAQKAVKIRDLSHVVKVWNVFYENDTAYIVMDYVKGETLKNHLLRFQRPLGEKECVELLAPVMRDLGEAHARGIIHRDIKPDNIMICPDGKPVLLDMGAAKDLGKPTGFGNVPSSALVVSQGFSPLEQYREHGDIGAWTDVYSMCATMYYCMKGRVLPAALDRLYEDTVDLQGLSPAMAEVLKKGLAVRAEDRIQSMEELLEKLNAVITGRPAAGTTQAPKKSPTQGSRRRKRAFAGAAVLLLAVLALSLWRNKEKPAAVTRTADPEHVTRTSEMVTATPFRSLSSSSPTPSQTPNPLPVLSKKDGVIFALYTDHAVVTGGEGDIRQLEIPAMLQGKPVTTVQEKAFSGSGSLESVRLPESVTSIQSGAFASCSALTTVYLVPGLESVESGVFRDCGTLKDVYFDGTKAQWEEISIADPDFPFGATIHFNKEPADPILQGWHTYTYDNGNVYEGEFRDNQRNGQGTMTYASGNRYEGEWKDDKRHGQGTFTWTNGDVYTGAWVEDRREGLGTYRWPDGSEYNGNWKDSKRQGQGTMVYNNGSRYEGGWQEDTRHGQGTMTYDNGNRYEGEWQNGLRQGLGTFTWTNGDVYTGAWVEDRREGYGTYHWPEGSEFKGNWVDSKRQGQGTMIYKNGNRYEGEWEADKRNGYGVFSWTNGDVYKGQWVYDEREGEGSYYWPNGDSFTGQWKNSKRNGYGTYTYANGSVKSGTWQDDQFIG